MIDRRQFVVTLGAAGLLAACQSGPPKPSVITVNVSGGAGMNPGPGGGDRPVTVLVMRLRSTGKFNSADYFALQGDAGSALAGDLIGSDQLAVGPGKSASKTITVEPDAAALGFVALIREPTGRNWRTTKSVSSGSKFTINVTLGSGGISA
ncbi:type VI secretion system lipoprotein TssJ [Mesorhizobium sp. M7A.F.Ca.US.011.01.1.1]|uniref:type VI secretion system lipoprotein TssJ n=1 Tax=Mesorhizobium sp. M7A.F.Ca.US.011.01.1.1 TaxID=2496741 RepID=UPI000FCC525C|nr:type VI secretion system lipoprotein TssJ [Mesorhizobium sp. M7A.F.Ca.US.011.01.1.1]RUX25440.1 type VI secretion system lipoprotein TssJ [Mesorhizobium sp. M7A.F.Ca.US.011.01.1.1]